MPQVHHLKTWPVYYDATAGGAKTFEARENDRLFETGDTVILERFDPTVGYTLDDHGDRVSQYFRVGYMLHGPAFGIKDGHCVFALENLHT